MRSLFLAGFLVVLFSLPAQAGSLFPPENIGSNPSVPCPNGSVLKWSGQSVVCEDPSPGVTIANCPTNQVLVGIDKGTPVCKNGYGGTFSKFIAGTAGDGQTIASPVTYLGCAFPNPLTGTCACPSGFSEKIVGGFDNRDKCAYYNPAGGCGIITFGCY